MAFADSILKQIATLKANAGVAVTFARGATSVPVTAIPGRSEFAEQSDYGVATNVVSHDWIVLVADLAAGGFSGLPAKGDTVTKGGIVYKVMQPPYSFYGNSDAVIRIHTKR